MGEPKKMVSAELPLTMFRELQAIAKKDDRKISNVVRIAVNAYLEPMRPIELLPREDEDETKPRQKKNGGKEQGES